MVSLLFIHLFIPHLTVFVVEASSIRTYSVFEMSREIEVLRNKSSEWVDESEGGTDVLNGLHISQ